MRAKPLIFIALVGLVASIVSSAVAQVSQTSDQRLTRNRQSSSQALENSTPVVRQLRAKLSEPICIDADSSGRIYVLDNTRESLIRFKPTGEVDKVWPQNYTTFYQFGRREFQLAADGRIFLSPAGALSNVHCIGTDGTSSTDFSTAPDIFSPHMATNENGFYYIYCQASKCIYAYAPDGTLRTKWDCSMLNSLAAGPQGQVYGAGRDKPVLEVYSNDGHKMQDMNLASVVTDERIGVRQVAVDTNGDIYIVDLGRWVVHLNQFGDLVDRWSLVATSEAKRISFGIRYIAVRNGIVYVLALGQGHSYEIQTYTPQGRCISRYIPPTQTLELPTAAAAHLDGSYALIKYVNKELFVYDVLGRRSSALSAAMQIVPGPDGCYYCNRSYQLLKLDRDGKTVATICGKDSISGLKDSIYQVVYDPTKDQIWTLCNSNKIITFTRDGNVIKETPCSRDISIVNLIGQIALDSKGCFYVPDMKSQRVVKFDPEGRLIRAFGKEGTAPGEFKYPSSIVIDKMGRLYVVDSGNSRIQCFSSDGKLLGVWGKPGQGDGELSRPLSASLGPNNTLWICDTQNDRIVHVSLDELWKQIHSKTAPRPAKGLKKNLGRSGKHK